MVLAVVLIDFRPATAGRIQELVSWILWLSTVWLALPWLLVVYQIPGALPDSPLGIAMLLVAAWTLNASIALRGVRFTILLQLALGIAMFQCVLLIGWSN